MPFLTYHLRLTSANQGDVYFVFSATQASSATYDIVRTEHLVRPAGYSDFQLAVQEDCTEMPWNVREDPVQTTITADSTGSPTIAKVAEQWLERCLRDHSTCGNSGTSQATKWYPKRLLDISPSSGEPRLILTNKGTSMRHYATLSHCWGSKPVCTLTADNIAAYVKCIPWHVLTKTFQDAILTVRRLGIQYIWIDSLCIMQSGNGSEQDWREHAIAMRSVYSNSLVNISAARAESGEDGAFVSRDPASISAHHVWWEVEAVDGELSRSFWTIRRPNQHASAAVKTLPLYSRGWVVQERYLAPRSLHFGADRIFWECNEEPWLEESFPDGFQSCCPEYQPVTQWPFNLNMTIEPLVDHDVRAKDVNRDPMRTMWQETIETYTRCDLSFPDDDILVALAGIAEHFGQSYSHQYVAGLFRPHLPYDLLWHHRGERSELYRAPSWSWASIDGFIDIRLKSGCPPCDTCCQAYAQVLHVNIDLVDPANVYGQVKAAKLTLRGHLIPSRLGQASSYGTGKIQAVSLHLERQTDDLPYPTPEKSAYLVCEAQIDTEEDSLRGSLSPNSYESWCLPIWESTYYHEKQDRQLQHEHRGLVLKRSVTGCYERMGCYSTQQRFMKGFVETGRQPQEICLV